MADTLGRRSARDPYLLALLFAALAAPPSGCGSGGKDDAGPPKAAVTGEVTSTAGAPLAGVQVVRVGGVESGVTGAAGEVALALPAGAELVLRLTRSGYLDRLEPITVPAGAASAAFSAVLLPREPPITIPGIEAGGAATGKHGTRATFPAGALVTEGGQPVSGAVAVTLTPIDVASGEALAFPGAYQGVPQGGGRAPIVSFGAADFEVTQAGARLRLAPGATAVIEIPLYATLNQDGSPVAAGQRIPLWSLDPQTGIWEQEGEAEVVASAASPTGLGGRATVSHFSPWNLDQLAGYPGSYQATPVRCVIGASGDLPQRDLPAGTSCTVKYTVGGGASPAEVRTETIPPEGTAGPLPAGVPMRLDGRARVAGALLRGVLLATLEPGGSGPLLVVLDQGNAPPTASAGPDQTVTAGATVQLDGSGSRDPDGDPLAFAWSFVTRPAGSGAALSGAATAVPTFVADVAGAYEVRLVVDDGKVASAPDTVRIMALPPPTLSIDDAQVVEGNSGTASLTFQVRLSAASPAPVTVDFATSDGTATAPADYQAGAGTLTFAAGATAATATVSVVGDTAVEPDETLTVTLSNAAGAVIADGQATGTIVDDDQAPPAVVTVVATSPQADETGEIMGVFTVTRTGPTADALVVTFTVGGTATETLDYYAIGTSVTIPAGQAAGTVVVAAFGDALVEGAETVVLTLVDGAAYDLGAPASATVGIVDGGIRLNEVTVVASDALAAEAGPDPGTFTITRTGVIALPLVVGLTVGGTATAGADYAALPATVTFPSEEGTAVLTVTPVPDALVEGVETVVLTVAEGTGYVPGPASHATVAIGDAALASVTVTASDAAAAERQTEPGAFTVSRSGPTAEPLVVTVTVGGTASAGADYQAIPASLTIPAGEASATVVVAPVDDAEPEGAETVTLTVAPGAGYAPGLPATATVGIADDDLPVVTVVAPDPAAAEAGGDPGLFTISRSGPTTAGLRVRFLMSGVAQNGTDYAAVPNEVIIPAGQPSATVTVAPIADQAVEGSETVVLGLALDLTGGYQLGSPSQATVTIVDATPPP
jgi:hypothetical protein